MSSDSVHGLLRHKRNLHLYFITLQIKMYTHRSCRPSADGEETEWWEESKSEGGFPKRSPSQLGSTGPLLFFSTELWNLGSLREDDPSLYFQPLLLLSSSSSTSEASTWDWTFYFTVLLSWCVTERSRRVEVILFIIIIYIFSSMEWRWTVLKDGPHIRKCNKSVIYHIMSSLIQS